MIKKKISLKTHVLPLIIILAAFVVSSFLIILTINSYLQKHMIEDSNEKAQIHSLQLTAAIESNRIANQLIKKQLTIAARVVKDQLESTGSLDHQQVLQLKDQLDLYSINIYNQEGRLLQSTSQIKNWQAPEDHPVSIFIKGSADHYIEEIRRASETGVYLKYAYFKAKNQNIVQVSVLAEDIRSLTKAFCTQNLIDSIVGRDGIIESIYLDKNNQIVFCGDEDTPKSYILSPEEESYIKNNQIANIKTKSKGRSALETIHPVYAEGEKQGSLIIFYDFNGVNALGIQISLIVLAVLIVIFIIYGYLRYKINIKNEEVEKLAYYDSISQVPNYQYLLKIMKESMAKDDSQHRTILIINHSNLHLVKMMKGQEALDELLRAKTQELKDKMAPDDQIFRYSEDSFLIRRPGERSRKEEAKFCEEILDSLETISQSSDAGKLIGRRIGVLELVPEDKHPTKILSYIDITINKIQKLEDKSYWFFDRSIQDRLILDERIEIELRKMTYDCYEKEFYLEYQPQIDIKTGKIIGFEALARWNSPKFGRVPPMKFITIAENAQLIVSLGDWIFKEACLFTKKIEEKSDFKVAINISAMQILREDFIDKVKETIKETGVNPENLEIEITESHFVSNHQLINDKFKELQSMGISISLDDFGTGYSSLSRLKDLNIDVLKIDKSFIDHIGHDEESVMFVEGILVLAKQLNIKTVAEGVETQDQLQILKDRECDIIQGYYYSKPLGEENALEFFRENI